MVEMLGVLAIIGVLSIGGIAGYSWGMDKHVANQILNEMNLNSLQLAMLLQKGNPDGVTLSLGSPYDDENPTFRTVNYGFQYGCGENAEVADPECEYINETRYFITALDLPERVAKMVAESAENLQYAVEVETDETEGFVTVFFDVDSGVTEYESRPEEPETSEHIYTPEVTEPTTTTTTVTTTPETTTTEATTTTESTTEATTTTLTTTTVTTTTQKIGECESNEDCEANQYCYFYSSNNCTKQTGYAGECRSNTPNGTVEVNGKTFIAKNEYMSWWSVENFCKSHNKSMVSISDLNCADEIVKTGYCHQTKAGNTSYDSNNISNTVTTLKGEFGSNRYWLSDMYDSCLAYTVSLNNGYVNYGNYRDSAKYFALCE